MLITRGQLGCKHTPLPENQGWTSYRIGRESHAWYPDASMSMYIESDCRPLGDTLDVYHANGQEMIGWSRTIKPPMKKM